MGMRLRLLLPLLVPAAVISLHADSTGRISGKVTSSDGKPIVGAVVALKRLDITWLKEIKTDAKGSFFQVGLEPREFEVTISAPGYISHREMVRIPLADVANRNVVLRTTSEGPAAGTTAAPAPEDAAMKAENDATEAFNAAVGFYSTKDYAQAVAPAETSYKSFKDALAKSTDEAAKPELAEKLQKANRLLGMIYFNAGKKADAKGLLETHLETTPKDPVVISALLNICKELKDKEGEAKYQAMMDTLEGPRPEIPYNEGVTALNAGNYRGAKEGALKALKVKADYADAYYILGIAEFGLNNLKAAKESLRKYLELAPTGSKAGEVKEMLKELR